MLWSGILRWELGKTNKDLNWGHKVIMRLLASSVAWSDQIQDHVQAIFLKILLKLSVQASYGPEIFAGLDKQIPKLRSRGQYEVTGYINGTKWSGKPLTPSSKYLSWKIAHMLTFQAQWGLESSSAMKNKDLNWGYEVILRSLATSMALSDQASNSRPLSSNFSWKFVLILAFQAWYRIHHWQWRRSIKIEVMRMIRGHCQRE